MVQIIRKKNKTVRFYLLVTIRLKSEEKRDNIFVSFNFELAEKKRPIYFKIFGDIIML